MSSKRTRQIGTALIVAPAMASAMAALGSIAVALGFTLGLGEPLSDIAVEATIQGYVLFVGWSLALGAAMTMRPAWIGRFRVVAETLWLVILPGLALVIEAFGGPCDCLYSRALAWPAGLLPVGAHVLGVACYAASRRAGTATSDITEMALLSGLLLAASSNGLLAVQLGGFGILSPVAFPALAPVASPGVAAATFAIAGSTRALSTGRWLPLVGATLLVGAVIGLDNVLWAVERGRFSPMAGAVTDTCGGTFSSRPAPRHVSGC